MPSPLNNIYYSESSYRHDINLKHSLHANFDAGFVKIYGQHPPLDCSIDAALTADEKLQFNYLHILVLRNCMKKFLSVWHHQNFKDEQKKSFLLSRNKYDTTVIHMACFRCDLKFFHFIIREYEKFCEEHEFFSAIVENHFLPAYTKLCQYISTASILKQRIGNNETHFKYSKVLNVALFRQIPIEMLLFFCINKYNETPLFFAACNINFNTLFFYIYDLYHMPLENIRNSIQENVVHWIATSNNSTLFDILYRDKRFHDAVIQLAKEQDIYGFTCIHTSILHRQYDFLKHLWKNNFFLDDILNAKSIDNNTILHFIASDRDVPREFFSNSKIFNLEGIVHNSEGYLPIHLACKFYNLPFIDFTLKHYLDVALFSTDKQNRSMLFYLIMEGIFSKHIEEVLNSCLNQVKKVVYLTDSTQKTLLHYAVLYFHTGEWFDYLCNKVIAEDLKSFLLHVDQDGNTPIHIAAMCNNKHVFEKISQKSSDFSIFRAQNHVLETPLHVAIKNSCFIVTKYIISCANAKDDIFKIKDIKGNIPLHSLLISEYKDIDCLKILILQSELDSLDIVGRNSICLALQHNCKAFFEIIFNLNMDYLPGFKQLDLFENTVFHRAVSSQHYQIILYILDSNVLSSKVIDQTFSIPNTIGLSCFDMIANSLGSSTTSTKGLKLQLKMLEDQIYHHEKTNVFTLLEASIKHHDIFKFYRLIKELKVSDDEVLNLVNSSDRNLIFMAAYYGAFEIFKHIYNNYICKAYTSEDDILEFLSKAKDRYGCTLLFPVVLYQQTDILSFLFETMLPTTFKKFIGITCKKGFSVTFFACKTINCAIMKMIFKAGQKVSDEYGNLIQDSFNYFKTDCPYFTKQYNEICKIFAVKEKIQHQNMEDTVIFFDTSQSKQQARKVDNIVPPKVFKRSIIKNPELAKTVLRKNGLELEYVDQSIKDSPEIVLVAIRQNPFSLQFASDSLRSSIDIVSAAVQLNAKAILYAILPQRLQEKVSFLTKIIKLCISVFEILKRTLDEVIIQELVKSSFEILKFVEVREVLEPKIITKDLLLYYMQTEQKRFQNFKAIKLAVKKSPDIVKCIDITVLSQKRLRQIVQENLECIQYLPNSVFTKQFMMNVIAKNELALLFFTKRIEPGIYIPTISELVLKNPNCLQYLPLILFDDALFMAYLAHKKLDVYPYLSTRLKKISSSFDSLVSLLHKKAADLITMAKILQECCEQLRYNYFINEETFLLTLLRNKTTEIYLQDHLYIITLLPRIQIIDRPSNIQQLALKDTSKSFESIVALIRSKFPDLLFSVEAFTHPTPSGKLYKVNCNQLITLEEHFMCEIYIEPKEANYKVDYQNLFARSPAVFDFENCRQIVLSHFDTIPEYTIGVAPYYLEKGNINFAVTCKHMLSSQRTKCKSNCAEFDCDECELHEQCLHISNKIEKVQNVTLFEMSDIALLNVDNIGTKVAFVYKCKNYVIEEELEYDNFDYSNSEIFLYAAYSKQLIKCFDVVKYSDSQMVWLQANIDKKTKKGDSGSVVFTIAGSDSNSVAIKILGLLTGRKCKQTKKCIVIAPISIVNHQQKSRQWDNSMTPRQSPVTVLKYTRTNDQTPDIINSAVELNGLALRYADPAKITKQIAIKAVTNNILALQHLDSTFEHYEDVVLAAVASNPAALCFLSEKYHTTSVYEKVFTTWDRLKYRKYARNANAYRDRVSALSLNLFPSVSCVKLMLKEKPTYLKYMPDEFKISNLTNIELNQILQAIYQTNIQTEQEVRNIFLEIAKRDGMVLKYAPITILQDLKVVLTAVEQNGLAIQYVAPFLWGGTKPSLQKENSENIVIVAVNQNLEAFKYINDNLNKNKKFMIELLQQVFDFEPDLCVAKSRLNKLSVQSINTQFQKTVAMALSKNVTSLYLLDKSTKESMQDLVQSTIKRNINAALFLGGRIAADCLNNYYNYSTQSKEDLKQHKQKCDT